MSIDTTTTIKAIETLAADLKRHLDAEDEAKAAIAAIKPLIADQIALLPDGRKTYKVSWGQLQRTVSVEWSYRDAGVTAAAKELEEAEARVAALRKVLKSRQEAAKAAKKAKPVPGRDKVTLRVVRGGSSPVQGG